MVSMLIMFVQCENINSSVFTPRLSHPSQWLLVAPPHRVHYKPFEPFSILLISWSNISLALAGIYLYLWLVMLSFYRRLGEEQTGNAAASLESTTNDRHRPNAIETEGKTTVNVEMREPLRAAEEQ